MLIALLAGCLALYDHRPARCPDTCDPFSCDVAGACLTECVLDDDCAAGYRCGDDDVCEEACEDDDCPDGFTCSEYQNECNTLCGDDGDCRDGYTCCDDIGGDCDFGECMRG
ncbi:MAG: hypothetical protein ACOZNI_36590 [Myxococcota bacterium]